METLLICPATRTEIVLGKFLTVMCFSMSSALLNLLSIGGTGKYMVSVASSAGKGVFAQVGRSPCQARPALADVDSARAAVRLVRAACCVWALATFARSSKEGQYYLTPLLMVSIGMTVFACRRASRFIRSIKRRGFTA